jgi:hypothetical protein
MKVPDPNLYVLICLSIICRSGKLKYSGCHCPHLIGRLYPAAKEMVLCGFSGTPAITLIVKMPMVKQPYLYLPYYIRYFNLISLSRVRLGVIQLTVVVELYQPGLLSLRDDN